jgi:hypothetical protein
VETFLRSYFKVETFLRSHNKVETFRRSYIKVETFLRSHIQVETFRRSHIKRRKSFMEKPSPEEARSGSPSIEGRPGAFDKECRRP